MEAKGQGGLGTLSYHVNEVRWTQGGHRGGRGLHSINILDSTIKQFIYRQDPRRWDWEYSTSQVKNLLTGLMHTNLLQGAIPLSYVHLVLHHVISVSWPSSFFTTLPLQCIIYTEHKPKNKNEGGLGMRLTYHCPSMYICVTFKWSKNACSLQLEGSLERHLFVCWLVFLLSCRTWWQTKQKKKQKKLWSSVAYTAVKHGR